MQLPASEEVGYETLPHLLATNDIGDFLGYCNYRKVQVAVRPVRED